MKRVVRILAIGGLLSATAAVAAAPASGAVGTWTKITAPKGPGQSVYQYFNADTTPSPTMTVSGLASPDVANVNIFCFSNLDQKTSSAPMNASPLPVSGGAFSGTGIPTPNRACILRAV